MSDRSIVVRLRAEVAEFKRHMGEAGQAVDRVAERAADVGRRGSQGFSDVLAWVNKNEQALSTLTTQVGLVGAGLVAFAGLAVKRFADFDQAMSGVASTSDDARANIDALRQAALDAGSRTVFSATEAAGAIEELSKAGLSAADILGGGLDGALDLAAAGSLDVAEAAGYTAIALQQFGLRGDRAAHVADLLAAGAGKAMGEVSDFGMALQQSGLVADQTGLSIEETTAALAAFANAGLLGSDAGTSLKTMLQRLTPQSLEARKMFDQLGISAYDAQGQFVGLEAFAGQLQDRMAHLTPEARNAAMSVMFGSDAVRAATVLYDQGAEGIRGWVEAVDDQGYAAEVAATKLNNLKGDVEGLMGSIDTALIGMGEGANGPLRDLVQWLDQLVDRFNRLPAPVQQATLLIAGGSGLALLGVAAIGKLLIALAEAQAAVQALGAAGTRTSAIMGALGRAAGLAGGALGVALLVDSLRRVRSVTDEVTTGAEGTTKALLGMRSVGDLDSLFAFDDRATAEVRDFASAIELLAGDGLWNDIRRGTSGLGELRTGVNELAASRTQVEALGEALAGLVQGGRADQAATKFDELAAAARRHGVSTAELLDLMPAYRDALDGQTNAQTLAAGSSDAVASAAERQALASQEAAEALAQWSEEVAAADGSFIDLLGGYQSIIDKNRETAEATAEATASSRDSWSDFYDGFTVSSGEYIAELERQAAAQQAWETNMLILSGRVSQGVIDHLARLGPEGAPLVAQLVNASDAELGRLEAVYAQQSSDATNAFASNLRAASPVLAAIMSTAGVDAANAAAAKLASGEATLQQVIDAYDLDFVVDADTGQAKAAVDRFITWNDGRRIRVSVDAGPGFAGKQMVSAQAHGSVMSFYANGDVRNGHVAQIARAGAWRVWAEPETGGESYIPHAPSKRKRSIDIWAETGRILGVPGFAQGDVVRGTTYATPARAVGGGGGDVHFHVDTINARDEHRAAERLVTKTRDLVATYGIETIGGGMS